MVPHNSLNVDNSSSVLCIVFENENFDNIRMSVKIQLTFVEFRTEMYTIDLIST